MAKTDLRSPTWAAVGAATGLALVVASILFPVVTGIAVRVHVPPLHADWLPRLKPLSIVPVAVAVLLLLGWHRVTDRLTWRAYLACLYAGSWLWTMSINLIDGPYGISRVFDRPREYLYDAKTVTDVHQAIVDFVSRIPYGATDHWQTHVAGHPPGALLFFVLLVRLGITSTFWVAFVVTSLGITAFVAAAVTVRALAGEEWVRRVGPWWVLTPAALWIGASGDAVFTATAAWGLALLALAATTTRRRRTAAYGLGAGVLLGLCVYLSYGLPLLAVLALAVLWLARQWSPLPWAVGGALVVVAAFTLAGFAWWEAYPVLRARYYAGIAKDRPYAYWVWADLAAWTFTVGLATWAAIPRALAGLRERNVVATLAVAGLTCITLASLSGMSKAEVERIFLPFTLWIMMIPALLPRRWERPLLFSQVVLALVVQHLLATRW